MRVELAGAGALTLTACRLLFTTWPSATFTKTPSDHSGEGRGRQENTWAGGDITRGGQSVAHNSPQRTLSKQPKRGCHRGTGLVPQKGLLYRD